jgi:hypothetical protein
VIITLVFGKNANFFAENCRKSQKIVIITSTPGHPDLNRSVALGKPITCTTKKTAAPDDGLMGHPVESERKRKWRIRSRQNKKTRFEAEKPEKTRDRCYDFLNIFAEKFAEKMAFLTENKAN